MSQRRSIARSVIEWRPSFRRNSWFTTLLMAGAAISFLVVGIILVWLITIDIPSVDGFHDRKVSQSTKIYDKTGKILLYDVHGTVRRTLIPLQEVGRHVRNATVAIEDAEFYEHMGIKPTAIVRAVLANIREGRYSQGGSTITQQVVKNTLLTPEKTITRKVKEWVLSIRIEQLLTKEQILEIYLNETPYGGTLYGVEEASKYFFGKSAKDVSLAEAAYLAALPQAPTYYSPFGNHRDALEGRKNLVLLKMKENGFITEEEYKAALTEKVVFLSNDETGIKAPHFVFYIREYLEEKYGVEAVSEGGLQVVTTLDYTLQQKAEELVRSYALENEKRYNAENAGLVAVDPRTGHIIVMVGSRGYFDEDIDGKFNVALALRQPGSSFKPFIYATAFAKGYTPDTVVFDVQTQFSSTCAPNDFSGAEGCYSPQNYDGVFRGPMTLRNALAQSVNIPAVKALYLAGIQESLDTARRLGITSLTRPLGYYGLPLVLGGGEVKLLEMVSAYGVFANNGTRHAPVGILSVKDASGELLEEYEETSEQVMDAAVANLINDVLSDNEARTPAFGAASALLIPGYDVAVKTGTTNDYRDVWIVGYTPDIAVGAWAGNNDNRAMEKKVAGFIIAPLWNEFMRVVLETTPQTAFIEPEQSDTSVGHPMVHGEWLIGGTVHSILHWVDKENPLGPPPPNPMKDSQYSLWEYGVLSWALGPSSTVPILPSAIPTPISPTQSSVAQFAITNPAHGSRVRVNGLLTISVNNPFGDGLKKVSYYANEVFMGSSSRPPFSISFVPLVPGPLTVRVVAESAQGQHQAVSTFTAE